MIEQIVVPIPPESGHPERFDSEYDRNGTANLLVAFQPPPGSREVVTTDRRAAMDFAPLLKYLAEVID